VGDEEGSARPEPETAADLDLLAKAGINCEWTSDIDQHRWVKIAVNAVINPLTVIFDCNNGELLRNTESIELMSALYKETSALFKEIGVPHGEEDLRELTESILQATHENISSMLQDYRDGPGRNELEYIMSPLIREAAKHEIDVPVLLEVESRANARFKATATPE
jgi:2-dehydropantoate 2-reductase